VGPTSVIGTGGAGEMRAIMTGLVLAGSKRQKHF
jgi:hypothetical protein